MGFDYLGTMEETIVAEGLEGKIIMIYGGNNLGKTQQSTKFPKPVTLPLEPNALNAIGGAMKLPVYDWAGFRDFTDSVYRDKVNYEKALASLNKELSRAEPKDKEQKAERADKLKTLQDKVDNSAYMQFRDRVTTINLDSLTALAKSAEKYVTDEADVLELSDGNRGKLYKRFENEVYHTVNQFFNLGDFTYVILAHEDFRNIGTEDEPIMQAIPKGDWKRVVKPVIDRCDIIVYLKSNGIGEDKREIPSSGIMAQCDLCFARTKWDNMDLYIKDFSAENLEKVVKKAITEQKDSGVKVGSFKNQQKTFVNNMSLDHEEVKDKIGNLVKVIYAHDKKDMDGVNMTKYQAIVDEFLGEGKRVSDTNAKQIGQLTNILSRTQDLSESLV